MKHVHARSYHGDLRGPYNKTPSSGEKCLPNSKHLLGLLLPQTQECQTSELGYSLVGQSRGILNPEGKRVISHWGSDPIAGKKQ